MAQVGGRPADALRYPYVAALSREAEADRVYFCAGTLVAPRWILTAAHCFHSTSGERISTRDLWAQVGATSLKDVPDAAQVRVDRIVLHPDYDPRSQADDIALVRLVEEAGPLIVEIADAASSDREGRVTILGFGSLYEGLLAGRAVSRRGQPLSQVSEQLNQAEAALVDPAECATRLGIGGAATGVYQICAASDGACVGDSGGPLIVEAADRSDRLAGIASFGSGCAVAEPVTVYTRVAAYSAWIAATIGGRHRDP